MKTQQEMTPLEAAGYIVGVVVGLVWRHYKFFVILLACALLPLLRIRITYDVPSDAAVWSAGLVQGVIAGLLAGIGLWFLHWKQRR